MITFPAWAPLLDPRLDFWEMDDARNHVVRVYHFNWLLAHGVWYPRWAPDMAVGYGYPVFNFYAPATYYLTALLQRLFRLQLWDGYRGAAVFVACLGATGTYALAVSLWRRVSLGVLASLAVFYAPYVFQSNLLRRGAVPEALALALIPWLLLAIRRLWLARTRWATTGWVIATALIGAAEILAHNLTAIVAAVAATVWVGYLLVGGQREGERDPAGEGAGTGRRIPRFLKVAGAGVLAACLSAVFWLPAATEGRAVQLVELTSNGGLDFRGWFVDPSGTSPRQQLVGNRQTRTGLIDLHLQYPHQRLAVPPKVSLGQALTAALALGGLLVAARRTRPSPAESSGAGPPASPEVVPALPAGALATLLGLAGVCWVLTFSVSAPVWEHVPGMALLQFPWRLLGLLGIALAVAGAGGVGLLGVALRRGPLRRGGRLTSGTAVVGGLAAVTGALLLVNGTGDRSIPFTETPRQTVDARAVLADEDADVVGVGTTSGREFLPRDVQLATYTIGQPRGKPVFEWLYPTADWTAGIVQPLDGSLRIEGVRAGALRVGVRVTNESDGPARLAVHQFAFPGWRAWIDGRAVPIGIVPYIPEQQASLGFMVLDVPPGEHTVGVAFGPTPVRLIGQGMSLAGVLVLVGLPLATLWQGRYAPPSLLVAVGGLAVAASLAAGWQMLTPARAETAIIPVSRPEPVEGRWGAPDLAKSGAGIVVNLAEATRRGLATVASPSGATLGIDKFADVRQLTVADEDARRGAAGVSRRQWLYLHPPSSVSVDVDLPPRQDIRFQAGLALDPSTWYQPTGDGVRFQVLVTPLPPTGPTGGGGTVVLDQQINPRAQIEHRRWVPVEVSLSRWAGTSIRLTLRTDPRDDLTFDWSGWGNPVVVVADSARGTLD